MFKVKKYPRHYAICIPHTPPRPKFSSVLLYHGPFQVMAHFGDKCTALPQNDLDLFTFKYTHANIPYTPEAHFSFVSLCYEILQVSSISLYDGPYSSYGPILRKVNQITSNDRNMFKVESIYVHTLYVLADQTFAHFALQ